MSIRAMLVAAAIVGAVVVIPLVLAPAPSGPEGVEVGEAHAPAAAAADEEAEAQPLPRFVDLGTTSCIPCKVMLGVMSELEERFPDTLQVEFIDVRANPDALEEHGFRAIPSQVFYAPDGRELFRHTGVMRADAIAAKWAELGHPITAEAAGGR